MGEDKKEGEKKSDKRKDDLISLKNKYKELEHKYKLALANYQNLLKQTAKEKQEFAKYANEQLLYEIIPVYDNLKISFQHVDNEAKKSGFSEGLQYIIKQFKGVLKNMGVEEIKTKGEKFDHNIMEAIEGNGDKVKKEIKSGYKLNGKVIMPAKVIVE